LGPSTGFSPNNAIPDGLQEVLQAIFHDPPTSLSALLDRFREAGDTRLFIVANRHRAEVRSLVWAVWKAVAVKQGRRGGRGSANNNGGEGVMMAAEDEVIMSQDSSSSSGTSNSGGSNNSSQLTDEQLAH
jgi:hypothetical protein